MSNLGGYGTLRAMSESSFRHVREAAQALESAGMDVSAAIRGLCAEGKGDAAWWLNRFVAAE